MNRRRFLAGIGAAAATAAVGVPVAAETGPWGRLPTQRMLFWRLNLDAAAFSPDGQYIAVIWCRASGDPRLRVHSFNPTTGETGPALEPPR